MKDLLFYKDATLIARLRVDSIPTSTDGNLTVVESYLLDDRSPSALNTLEKVKLATEFKKLPNTWGVLKAFAVDNDLTLEFTESNGDNKVYLNGSIEITTSALDAGTEDAAYSEPVEVEGGSENYTFAVTVGTLPAGLTLNASTGVIAGTPTTAGTSNFTVRATDALFGFTDTAALSIVIAGA